MSTARKTKAKAGLAPRHRIFAFPFAKIYAALLHKAERKSRYLDKLIDELAQGKAMEKILRQDL